MKKFLSILMIAFIASFTVTSCGSSDGGGNTDSAKCTQWDSKNAVEERIESLGHIQTSINLNDNVDCRYQWLVQFISDNGESGYCAITTDGSSGVVEIVDVSCM